MPCGGSGSACSPSSFSSAPGEAPPAPAGMGDFLKQLETARIVSCTEAAGRFLGLSMAGWNAVVSLALAAFAAAAALPRRAPRAA